MVPKDKKPDVIGMTAHRVDQTKHKLVSKIISSKAEIKQKPFKLLIPQQTTA